MHNGIRRLECYHPGIFQFSSLLPQKSSPSPGWLSLSLGVCFQDSYLLAVVTKTLGLQWNVLLDLRVVIYKNDITNDFAAIRIAARVAGALGLMWCPPLIVRWKFQLIALGVSMSLLPSSVSSVRAENVAWFELMLHTSYNVYSVHRSWIKGKVRKRVQWVKGTCGQACWLEFDPRESTW